MLNKTNNFKNNFLIIVISVLLLISVVNMIIIMTSGILISESIAVAVGVLLVSLILWISILYGIIKKKAYGYAALIVWTLFNLLKPSNYEIFFSPIHPPIGVLIFHGIVIIINILFIIFAFQVGYELYPDNKFFRVFRRNKNSDINR